MFPDKTRTYADDISLFAVEKEPLVSPPQRARCWGWGGERHSQARDHNAVGGGHVSVSRAGAGAAVGAGAAGIDASYGR